MAMQRNAALRSLGDWEDVAPASRDEWEEVLATDPAALPSQTPAWVAGICATGPYVDVSRVYRRRPDGGRLILPLVRRTGRAGAIGKVDSLPRGFGGLVSEGGVLSHRDVTAVLADLRREFRGSILMNPAPSRCQHYDDAAGWSSNRHRYGQVLDLSGGFEEVWSRRFSSSARRAVRKAERSEITVVRDTTGRLSPHFTDLYQKSVVRWAKQKGIPSAVARLRASRRESTNMIRGLATSMGESWVTWMAFVDGAPASSIIVLNQGPNSHYWHGAMDLELAGPVRANDLLHKLAIEEACNRGHDHYWLGGSGYPGSGLWRFKASLGASPAPFNEYVLEQLPLVRTSDVLRSTAKRALRQRVRLQQRLRDMADHG